ncbi:MAG: hypothetical protein GY929_08915 [Actinomycetia bacterium]|nr:hypothetical protein [Actinomycetes bacterium]
MNDDERLAAERACEKLIIRYTHIADFGPGETMPDLFTDDAVWESGEGRYEGRDEEKPRVPDLDDQPVILGEYRDQFRRTADGWRIANRRADVGFVRRSALKG